MAKTQGTLPIYDPETKRILGAYTLPYSKTFDGTETTHCIDYPNTPDASNTVNVAMITPNRTPINNDRKQNDWYMAAVFTHAQVYNQDYRGFPHFADLPDMLPTNTWSNPASHAMGQDRPYDGPLLRGLSEDFTTGADNELMPINTVLPTITGAANVGGTATSTAGTWIEQGTATITYQWYDNGVAIGGATASSVVVPNSVGHTLTLAVTHTYSGYAKTVTTVGVVITA